MNALTQRYAPGGDIHATLTAKYGANGAARVFEAAQEAERTGDRSLVADAIGQLKYGDDLNKSTLSLFGSQIYNEPLQAPLEQASRIAENAVKTSLGNWGIWVIVAALVGGFILWRKI